MNAYGYTVKLMFGVLNYRNQYFWNSSLFINSQTDLLDFM